MGHLNTVAVQRERGALGKQESGGKQKKDDGFQEAGWLTDKYGYYW